MLQAVSQQRGPGDGIAQLADQPDLLERGLKVLDVGLRLTPDLTLDLVLKDATSRPVIVLGEGDGDVPALLGRALFVLVEVRRARGLLEKLFRADAVSFAEDPRVVLCFRRVPDALLEAGAWLKTLSLELAETRALPIQGANRLVVVRAGGESQGSPPAADPPRSKSKASAHAAAAPPASKPSVAAPPPPTAVAPPVAPIAGRVNGRGSLVDEAKKKILRIGDEIEEEVDGDVVRFRVHDEVLAVLEAGDELALSLGDAPALRRPIRDRIALEAAVDDVVRRFFTLVRQARPRVLNGHVGSA